MSILSPCAPRRAPLSAPARRVEPRRPTLSVRSAGARRGGLRRVTAFGAVLALALAGGCAQPLPELPEEASLTSVTDPDARRLLAEGDPLGASEVYAERATRALDDEQRDDYLLIAAEILFDYALFDPARERLLALPESLATVEQELRRDILVARDLLAAGDAEAALIALPEVDALLSPLHRARVLETEAMIHRALDDPDAELLARIALGRQLGDEALVARNHEAIWQLLARQPLSALRALTTNVRGAEYEGWVALALAHADAGEDRARRAAAFARWRSLYPAHPAGDGFVAALLDPADGDFRFDGDAIERVAVLLPLSASGVGPAAAAIRDGLIAAWLDAREKGGAAPTLRFYDLGENTAYARTAYGEALADGADAMIGPLRKEAVAAIATQRRVPVPTITLNTVDVGGGERAANIVQFGLAPEDEARAAAERAAALSLLDAIVLQSDDSRGDREARAFRDTLYAYGGDVVHLAVLPNEGYDYSEQIREALAIDESDARFRRLSSTIGEKLFFEPSIRDDVDVVFLAVGSEQARSLRPQLDFFHASGVPRLATSRVAVLEQDDEDGKKAADLNTIVYPDAPWTMREALEDDPLRQRILASFPDAEGAYAKLYALGVDAYRLVANLDALAAGETLAGYTGDLSLGPDGRVRRELDWAQYREGVSVPIERVVVEPLEAIGSGPPIN